MNCWSFHADKVLREVFANLPEGADAKTVKRLIRNAYPFGERSYWPYKAWGVRARAWFAAWQSGLSAPPPASRKAKPVDRETGDLFTSEDRSV